jgi:hypothetical protein
VYQKSNEPIGLLIKWGVKMINKNPFYILEVTTRDKRQKIVEMAEEKSLEIDEEVCQTAQSVLIIPSKRLNAEIDWFPGVSPSRVKKILSKLNSGNIEEIEQYGLPPIAKVNILLEVLQNESIKFSKSSLKNIINEIVDAFDSIDIETVVRDINEDRDIAGFPNIENYDLVESFLDEKRRTIVKSILARLDKLDTSDLIELMTEVVEDATDNGEKQASQLIDDLVDDYKLHTHDFLEEEAEKILQAINVIKKQASEGEQTLQPIVKKLLFGIKKWDDVAQPIQLNSKSRGIDDQISQKLAYALRGLAIDLYNNYNMMNISKKIFLTLLQLFRELPDIEDLVQEDIQTLQELEARKKKLVKQILNELNVEGIDNMSSDQIVNEINKGAKFKRYKYCQSFIVVTYNKVSPTIFIKSTESSIEKAIPYILQSLFLGWWGIPWGPIYTIGAVFQNIFGGEDLTKDIIKIMKEFGVYD